MDKPITDRLGNTIEVGDLIVYAVRASCAAYLKHGEVIGIRYRPRFGSQYEMEPRIKVRTSEQKTVTLGHSSRIAVVKKSSEKYRQQTAETNKDTLEVLKATHNLCDKVLQLHRDLIENVKTLAIATAVTRVRQESDGWNEIMTPEHKAALDKLPADGPQPLKVDIINTENPLLNLHSTGW